MLNISDYPITNKTHKWTGQVTIDFTDYNLDNSISAGAYEEDRLTDNSQMADGIETPAYRWFSYQNTAPGYHFRSASKTQKEKGALSKRLSQADGYFFNHAGFAFGSFFSSPISCQYDYPAFDVCFSARTVSSIKVVFDDKLEEYAKSFKVRIYQGGTLAHTETVAGNTSYKFTKILSSDILLVTCVSVQVLEWSSILSKAKVIESFTSIQREYTNDEVIGIAINEEIDPEAATSNIGNVTANTCNIELININSEFDNENTESILAGNVIKNRRVKPFVKLFDSEAVPLGVFYTKDWNINNEEMTASASCQDVIGLMQEQTYNKSQFITPPADQTFNYTNITADLTVESVGYCFPYGMPYGFAMEGFFYTGNNIKTVVYDYEIGTTVRLEFECRKIVPTGSSIAVFANYGNGYEQVTGDSFVFMPLDQTLTTQQVLVKFEFVSQSIDNPPVITNCDLTISEYVSLYSLAVKVIEDFDNVTNLIQGKYSIAQEYGSFEVPNAFFTKMTHREALIEITRAACGRAYVSRDGWLTLDTIRQVGTPVKTYTDDNLFSKNLPVKSESLYNRISVKTSPRVKKASTEEIAKTKIDLAIGETNTFEINFDSVPVEDSTVTFSGLPASVTITAQTVYNWGCVVTITNASGAVKSFDLVVTGYVYELTGQKTITLDDSASIRKNGIIEQKIESSLIQTDAQALQIASTLLQSYIAGRREVVLDVIPDPRVELGNTIQVNGGYYLINSQELRLSAGELTHLIGGKK
jgi:hypothetical protein